MPSQVLILSRGDRRVASIIRTQIKKQLADWTCSPPKDLIAWASHVDELALDKNPAVCLFIGGNPTFASTSVDRQVDKVLAEGLLVLPIVSQTSSVADLVPESLISYIAQAQEKGWAAKVSGRLLEELELGPGRLRIFISYGHADGTHVARQLEDILSRDGMSVFLDERHLRVGDSLPTALHGEIARSDLVVQLRTPDAAKSEWVRKEAQLAYKTHAGFLAVVWPRSRRKPMRPWWEVERLRASDFIRNDPARQLSGSSTQRLVERVRESCLKAVALRKAILERGMWKQAKAKRWPAERISDVRGITVQLPGVGPERWVSLVGVPGSRDLERSERSHRNRPTGESLRIVVDHRVQPPNDDHLEWLGALLEAGSEQHVRVTRLEDLHRVG